MTKRLCGIILETHGTSAMVGPVCIDKTNDPPIVNQPSSPTKSDGLQSIASALNISTANIPQNILANASFAIQNIMQEADGCTQEDGEEKTATCTDETGDNMSYSSLSFGLEVTQKTAETHRGASGSLSIDIDSNPNWTIQPDIYLETQSIVRIITDRIIAGDSRKFSICFPGLCHKLSIGKCILIHPSIKLEVIESDKSTKILRCLVLSGGPLKEYSKVEFPSLAMKWGITQQDVNDIGFAVQNHVDYICISKVQSVDDITTAREMVEFQAAALHSHLQQNESFVMEEACAATCGSLRVLAKIEDCTCLDDIDAIITEADGIVIDELPLLHSYSKSNANAFNMDHVRETIARTIHQMVIATRKQAKPVAVCCELMTNIKDIKSNKSTAQYINDLKLLNDIPDIPINPSSFLTLEDMTSIESCVAYAPDSVCLLSDLNRFKQLFKQKSGIDNENTSNGYWRSMDDDMLYVHGLMRSIIDVVKQKERKISVSQNVNDYYTFIGSISCHNSTNKLYELPDEDPSEDASEGSYSDSNERRKIEEVETIFNSMASSAVKSAFDLNCSLIIVFTQSGRIARIVSKYRPHCVVLAITDSEVIARQCMLISSIFPILVLNMNGTDSLISRALYIANKYKLINKKNEKVVVLAGTQSDILDEPC
eukprot:121957_1